MIESEEKMDETFDEKIDERNEEQPIQIEETQRESDVKTFLRSLKLEHYFESFVENGADKLGQLVYVDDSVIDQLCCACGMKIVHAGVFKKAIKECKIGTRMSASSEHAERQNSLVKMESQKAYMSMMPTQFNTCQQSDGHYGMIDRRRYAIGTDQVQPYSNNNHFNAFQMMATTAHNGEVYGCYTRPYTYQSAESQIQHNPPMEEITRVDYDRSFINHDTRQPNSCHSSEHDDIMPQTLPDGSYYVVIGERTVKFPPTVKLLTVIDRIDSDRKDIVRKGSQIYGRDDTKRKHNELNPLEIFMNEIAYEICLRDFTYMISRQRLLGLVREIVKDNQIQLSGHHPSYNSFSSYIPNGKTKADKTRQSSISDTVVCSANAPDEIKPSSDYDIILYHKLHKEWPPTITKERKKYLGRRSSNFEVLDNVLYYAKDQRRRRWVYEPSEVQEVFLQFHIDPDTGEHYTRELTIERISHGHYFRDMATVITELFLGCQVCRERFSTTMEGATLARGAKHKMIIDQDTRTVPVFPTEIMPNLQPVNNVISDGPHKRSFDDVSLTDTAVPLVKKSRKSKPQKLNVDGPAEYSDRTLENGEASKHDSNEEIEYDMNNGDCGDTPSPQNNGSYDSMATGMILEEANNYESENTPCR